MRRFFFGLTALVTMTLTALADTGTPYPAGTRVEITTQAGTISGTLQDRTLPGWFLLLEKGRTAPTAVPEKSVAFIRAEPGVVLPPLVPPKPVPPTAPPAAPESFEGHHVFGAPRVADRSLFAFRPFPGSEEVEGLTVLKRFAFTLGHYDRHKVPAWVAMRWDREHHDIAAKEEKHPRNFREDPDLPPFARTGKDYEHAKFGYERGHMARHEDLSGFHAPGDRRRGTREGCLMSNIVPTQRKGHEVWGRLENEHHKIAASPDSGIRTLWLLCGPIFEKGKAEKVIGPDRVGAPKSLYKIIAWRGPEGKLTARSFIIHQDSTGGELTEYLTTVNDIEAKTGLDFFSDLDDVEEEVLEATRFTTLWGKN